MSTDSPARPRRSSLPGLVARIPQRGFRLADIVRDARAIAPQAGPHRDVSASRSRYAFITLLLITFAIMLCAVPPRAAATDIADVSVFALGPLDGRAVFRFPDGKMMVLKLGDPLDGTRARLVQVLSDRAVLEDIREAPGQPPVRELVWLYKADAQGRSLVQRFTPQAPPPTRIERAK